MRVGRIHALVGAAAALATVTATALAGAAPAAAAPPPGVSIPCGNVSALIAAIVAANADTGPSTIVLATDCTYVLTSEYMSSGDGLPPITEDVQLVGNFSRIERSPSAPDFRIIEVSGTGYLISTGIVYSNGIAEDGGCMLMIDSATLTINGGAFHNCEAVGGGAIADEVGSDGPLTITGVHFAFNLAEEVGGAIYINDNGVMKLQGSTLTDNVAVAGGAIFTDGSVVLTNTAVYENLAFDVGGGILKDGGIVLLVNSEVAGNTPENCFPVASVPGCYL